MILKKLKSTFVKHITLFILRYLYYVEKHIKIRLYFVDTWSWNRSPFQLRFDYGLILVQIICKIVRRNPATLFPFLKLFICGASQIVAVSIIFKVFGVTRT